MLPTLDYYTKPDDASDTVLIGVYVAPQPGVKASYVVTGSDATLTARAATENKSTWDEDTICAEHGLQRKPRPADVSDPTPDAPLVS